MIHITPRHVRTRLTLWYVGVLSAVLAVFVVGTSSFLFLNLRSELDRNTIQDLETIEGLLTFAPNGTVRLGTDDHDDHEEEYTRFMEVRSPEGALLYRNKNLGSNDLGGAPEPGEGKGSYSERSARLSDGTRIRLVSRIHTIGDRPVLIRLAHSEEPLWQDSCSGMGLEHQSRVFDRFYRVDRDRSRDSGGAGLGLSITKWAVEANAGRIDLESRGDKGCTFRIRLPLAAIRSR